MNRIRGIKKHKRKPGYYFNPTKQTFYTEICEHYTTETTSPGSGRRDFNWRTLSERQAEMKARMLHERRCKMISGIFFRLNGVWAEEEGLDPRDFYNWKGLPLNAWFDLGSYSSPLDETE